MTPSRQKKAGNRRRRKHLRREVYLIVFLIACVAYQFNEFRSLTKSTAPEPSALGVLKQQAILKDREGKVVSRNSTSLSQFLGDSSSGYNDYPAHGTNITLVEATKGRERILSILEDAGILKMHVLDVLKLPKWNHVESLYGSGPIILGLDRCEAFRKSVPLERRFIGVSGMFNTGTTAFGISLQANCFYDGKRKDFSNDVVKDVNGMLNQVPWAKHKHIQLKYNHTINPDIVKDYVLPIVLVRDPYFWMHSMCKQGYGARWDRNPEKHCPNLVPDEFDRKRFKRLRNASSVPVWMGQGLTKGPSWPSLVHLWNDWYRGYFDADSPRIIIRFEDTLFHGKEVMRQVCECGGAQQPSQLSYVVDEAKWDHTHAQSNMVTAIIKYGTESNRYRNMTNEDLLFAHKSLSPELMEEFHYKHR